MTKVAPITKFIAAVLLLLSAWPASGQDGLLRRGDRSYRDLSYPEAIALYELAFTQGATSIIHARRLGDSYWRLRELNKAAPLYALVANSAEALPEDLYRHAELLRASGRFAESDTWLARFAERLPHDSRGWRKANSAERLAALMEERGLSHQITPVPFNSDRTDMSPFIQGDSLLFSSARMPEYMAMHRHTWNDQPFLDLYMAAVDKDGLVTGIRRIKNGSNSTHHESNAILSKDGNQLYFTRNAEGKTGKDANGVINLEIHIRHRTAIGWSKDQPFSRNIQGYSTGHPALGENDRVLYFTSDRPGGVGGRDIWMCERNDQGHWGEPRILEGGINTEGDEMFPYVHGNYLYFASDGHLGFGGLDLFRVRVRNGVVGEVENLNMPINGPGDDFGLCINGTGDIGFLTSDRNGPVGGEEIYLFRMHSRPEDERVWAGRVMDERTARPVPHLTMRLLDLDENELTRTTTSADGTYEFHDPGMPALISATIPGGQSILKPIEEMMISDHGDTELPDIYLNSVLDLPVNAILRDGITDRPLENVAVTVKDVRDGTVLFHGLTDMNGIAQGQIPDRQFGDDLALEVSFSKIGYFTRTVQVDFRVLMFLDQALTGPEGQWMSPITEGIDMSTAMNLRPIFFDYNEAEITSTAAGELDLVARVMQLDPSIRIELRSHTDSRASEEFNDRLSQRRADNTKAYLVALGIAPFRIKARGIGERELLNHCTDDVPCTEEEHFANRRAEFIVTGCDGCGNHRSTVSR